MAGQVHGSRSETSWDPESAIRIVAFLPNGNLFVQYDDGTVLRCDGSTARFISVVVEAGPLPHDRHSRYRSHPPLLHACFGCGHFETEVLDIASGAALAWSPEAVSSCASDRSRRIWLGRTTGCMCVFRLEGALNHDL